MLSASAVREWPTHSIAFDDLPRDGGSAEVAVHSHRTCRQGPRLSLNRSHRFCPGRRWESHKQASWVQAQIPQVPRHSPTCDNTQSAVSAPRYRAVRAIAADIRETTAGTKRGGSKNKTTPIISGAPPMYDMRRSANSLSRGARQASALGWICESGSALTVPRLNAPQVRRGRQVCAAAGHLARRRHHRRGGRPAGRPGCALGPGLLPRHPGYACGAPSLIRRGVAGRCQQPTDMACRAAPPAPRA